MQNMKKYIPFVIPIILLILTIGAFLVCRYYQNKPKPIKWIEYSNEDFKLKVSYPESFLSKTISEDDKKAKYIFKSEQISPSALFSIRTEERVGVLALAQKGSVLDVLSQNCEKQYPGRYTDFKKEKQEKINVDNTEASQFYFTYLGTDNSTRMKQRFVIVTKQYEQKELGTVAFYLSFQSQESDFNQLNSNFQKILDSFKFLSNYP